LSPTILAGVVVTTEYLGPAQLLLITGPLNQIDESDYGGYLEHLVNSVKLTTVVLQHFGFAAND
jgi:hypothetical protein